MLNIKPSSSIECLHCNSPSSLLYDIPICDMKLQYIQYIHIVVIGKRYSLSNLDTLTKQTTDDRSFNPANQRAPPYHHKTLYITVINNYKIPIIKITC